MIPRADFFAPPPKMVIQTLTWHPHLLSTPPLGHTGELVVGPPKHVTQIGCVESKPSHRTIGGWCKVTNLGMLYNFPQHFRHVLMCLWPVGVWVGCVCAVEYERYGIRTVWLEIRISRGRKRGATCPHPLVGLGEWGDRGQGVSSGSQFSSGGRFWALCWLGPCLVADLG